MATAKKAETAQELKAKYNRKRLTPTTAAQYYIYNYLYWAYLTNETNKEIDYLHNRIVKDETPIYDLLMRNHTTGGDAYALYEKYGTLCEWLNTAFENAVLMRNALIDYLTMFMSEATNATVVELVGVAGENIKRKLIHQAYSDKDLSTWLEVLITGMKENTRRDFFLNVIRNGIQKNLCYLNAYNTLIEIIAKHIKIPELTFMKVEMKNVDEGISMLNKSLEGTREAIERRGNNQDENDRVSLAPPYTPEEKSKLLESYGPISKEAPPIPNENLVNAVNVVKLIFGQGTNFSWSMAFNAISKDYWRR